MLETKHIYLLLCLMYTLDDAYAATDFQKNIIHQLITACELLLKLKVSAKNRYMQIQPMSRKESMSTSDSTTLSICTITMISRHLLQDTLILLQFLT